MTNMTRVAAGLDGTNAAKTKYSFRCPEVDPPAPIYFYQFSLDGEEPAWTERFAIAAPNGTLASDFSTGVSARTLTDRSRHEVRSTRPTSSS